MNKYLLPLFVGTIFLLAQCQKKKEETPTPQAPTAQPSYKNLVRYEQVTTYTPQQLRATIALAAPQLLPLTPSLAHTARVYKIVYKTKYQQVPIEASGIICLPDTSLPFPLVSFQHGTLFQDKEVPSRNVEFQFQMAAIASSGYVALAPDYIGFGSSAALPHPYYVAEYAAASVKDLILAAQEMLKTLQMTYKPHLFLAGYSQGGNVTMAAAKELEALPIQGLTLKASGVGAGGYNMEGMFRTIVAQKTFPSPNYLAYILHSYHQAYQLSVPYGHFFQSPYAGKIYSLIDGETSADAVNEALTEHVDSLLQPLFVRDVLNKSSFFNDLLSTNSLHEWVPKTPIRFYHGDKDEIVPYSDTESTFANMKAKGAAQISFIPLPGMNHSGGVMPMIIDLLPWWKSLQ